MIEIFKRIVVALRNMLKNFDQTRALQAIPIRVQEPRR
jgi:hypothetical protein